MHTDPPSPTALSIATSDSGCGAGIQADLLTFAANKVYGLTALAALTAQNPIAVTGVHPLPAPFLQLQLDTLQNYFNIGAIKTGMLFNRELIEVAARFLRESEAPAVVDPVMVATSGAILLDHSALEVLQRKLLPAATLLTPNLDEVAALLGRAKPGHREEMIEAGQTLSQRYQTSILVKGGHLPGNTLIDILITQDGELFEWSFPRIDHVNTHGSGCTLAAAIAAQLALGQPLPQAVENARSYLLETLAQPVRVGSERFIAHL